MWVHVDYTGTEMKSSIMSYTNALRWMRKTTKKIWVYAKGDLLGTVLTTEKKLYAQTRIYFGKEKLKHFEGTLNSNKSPIKVISNHHK